MTSHGFVDRFAKEKNDRQKINELEETLAESGMEELPRSIEEIGALENEGHVVDLETGELIEDGADLPIDSPRLESGFVESLMARACRKKYGKENFPSARPRNARPNFPSRDR